MQGLRNHGFEITTPRYLSDYEKTAREARKRFKGKLRKAMKGISWLNEHDCFWALDPVKEPFPDGRKIDEEDFRESGCSTAIYVLTRQAGEGRDRRDAPGDFRLSENEIANITFVAHHYRKSILVINAGSSCDLSRSPTCP